MASKISFPHSPTVDNVTQWLIDNQVFQNFSSRWERNPSSVDYHKWVISRWDSKQSIWEQLNHFDLQLILSKELHRLLDNVGKDFIKCGLLSDRDLVHFIQFNNLKIKCRKITFRQSIIPCLGEYLFRNLSKINSKIIYVIKLIN